MKVRVRYFTDPGILIGPYDNFRQIVEINGQYYVFSNEDIFNFNSHFICLN